MASRIFDIKSPLGKDLTFRSMTVDDGISNVFTISLELRSRRADIDPTELLGKSVSVAQQLAGDKVRHFSGYCSSFRALGLAGAGVYGYHVTLRPWIWFLSMQVNSRIFQKMTIPDILKKIFEAEKMVNTFVPRLKETYPEWEYCVQYRESTLNFVLRLMEQEGIYFYFEHSDGKHALILCDSQQTHKSIEGEANIRFSPPDRAVQAGVEHVSDWAQTRTLKSGRYSTNDYDPLNPSANLMSSQIPARPPKTDKSAYEVFDFPGEFVTADEGRRYAQVRVEELQLDRELYTGAGMLHQVIPGRKFALTHHPVKALNKEYLFTHTSLNFSESDDEAGGGSENSFHFSFSAIPSDQQFRPMRLTPKPLISGIQTAFVMGPSGEEIHTDNFGRVKVKFHWDRADDVKDEERTCWIRVATPWASSGFGFSALPRVGDEVVVTFIEGDPDLPLITGSVYNKQLVQPYQMPGSKSQSGIRSRSYKGGGQDNFNEIKFEDKKGGEVFSLQAEKDLHSLVKNDQVEHIKSNFHSTVDSNEFHKVGKKFHLETGSDSMIKVGGTQSTQAAQDVMTKAGSSFNVQAGNEIHLKSGATIVLESGAGITLKVGGNYVSITPAGVSIQGAMVMINSGGAPLSGSGLRLQSPTAPRTVGMTGRIGSKPKRQDKKFQPGPEASALKASAQGGSTFSPQKCDC